MSLFNITRYTGESQLNEEKASKSDLLLSRLNEKALKRKLELASTIETSHSTRGERNPVQKDARTKENSDLKVQKEDSTGHKLAKSKKKSDITEDLNNVSTSALKSNSSPSVTKSKTKKEDVHSASKEESDAAILQMDSAANVSDTADRTEGEQESDSVSGNEDDDRSKEGTADRDIEGDPNKPKSFTVLGEVLKKKKQKVERVLPQWLAHPSVVKADIRSNTTPLSGVCGIDQQLTQKLRDNNIHSYFPVQAQVIPALLADHRTGFLTGRAGYRPCDICCSAPTGSGKTLAYVLPIVQCLKARVTCQVRALVVLPVRDLALQVFKVFQTYCEGTPLKVGAVVGLKSFHQEQQSLSQKSPVSGEYQSKVDILVATPGRLVDHINTTPGLSLAHLRYLVIDEADRMMDEIKQDWLTQVERCVFSHNHQGELRLVPGPLSAANMAKGHMPLQKLLFSATLSQNPEKLEQLGLFQPRLFTSVVEGGQEQSAQKSEEISKHTSTGPEEQGIEEQVNISSKENPTTSLTAPVKGDFIGKFTTPTGLTEFYCPCSPSQKPLAMLYFLHQLKFRNVLCFTNSVEVTHRLYWLIKLVGGVEVKEFSSKQHAQKRAKLLTQFKAGKIHVLVCSDAMARGMDISNVRYVISYESPPFLKTYIHRVGRTARAGNVGTAVTLLQKKEIYHFKKMLREAGKTSVKEMRLNKTDLKPFVEPLAESLKQLPDILKSEKMNK